MPNKETVSSVIRDLIKKEETPRAILKKNVRFSVTLTALQNKRLEILAGKIETTKQDLISKVLDAAMVELEDQLGLIDMSHMDSLGLTTYQYQSRYVREIIEALGISEGDWDDIIDKDWNRL
ncbi:hypothetical protein [Paenibacillus methanolicus]|uniref:Uncharacterized protein n=1 Tax=Paenibacillus methanolicus TaxID=582686 RepID=A0A5S5BZF1_9BACL|nr:hypothetical protein [Paenibacillus methanolicus]TYP71728.1 hypothetical protein BCM02_1096 [Paenibacillus methanolicus]